MTSDKREHLFSVAPVTSVDDYVETDAPERGIGAKPMDPDVKDVDVLSGENSGQLVQESRFVVEPGAEGEITAR
jgi:hypothetical protein